MNKKETFILLGIMILTLFFQVTLTFLAPIPDTDEVLHFETARGFFEKGSYQFLHPPFYFWLLGMIFRVFGESLFLERFFSSLASLGVIIFTFLLGRFLKNNTFGLWSSFLLGINPTFIYFAHTGYIEMLLTLLLVSSFYVYSRFLKSTSRKELILAGILSGLALATKDNAVLFIGTIFLILGLKSRSEGVIYLLPIIGSSLFLLSYLGWRNGWLEPLGRLRYLLSFFNPKRPYPHAATWQLVSNLRYFEELLGTLTPPIVLGALAETFRKIKLLCQRKLSFISAEATMMSFLIIYSFGMAAIIFKDIHYPVPILPFMVIFATRFLIEKILPSLTKFKPLLIVILLLSVWLASPGAIFYHPFERQFYDNLYLYVIKQDRNYSVYQKIAHYLNSSLPPTAKKVIIDDKGTILSFYLRENLEVIQAFSYSPQELVEIIPDVDSIVWQTGQTYFSPQAEREILSKIKKNFYLAKVIKHPWHILPISTSLKPLKKGEKFKIFSIYLRQ